MTITYKFPFNLNPTAPAEFFLNNELASVAERSFDNPLETQHKNVNFILEDYINQTEYAVKQIEGGLMKKTSLGSH